MANATATLALALATVALLVRHAQAGSRTEAAECTNKWCAAAGPMKGERSLIMIRPIYNDIQNACDKDCMREFGWGKESGADQLFKKASFGMVSFPEGLGKVLDVTVDLDVKDSAKCDSSTWRYAAIAAAQAQHGINAQDYEHIVAMLPPVGVCRNPGAAGGNWVNYFYGGVTVITHELGHAVGMSHATFNDPAARAANPKSGEYRDGYDVMGSGSDGDRAFNLPHRLYMNWLPETDVHQLYDDDLAATCGNGKEVTAQLHTYVEQAGPAGSKKGLVIKDCQDGRDWFISTTYSATNTGPSVFLHRCHEFRTPDSCVVTDLFEVGTPPDGSDESTHTQFAADEGHRFTIKIGVPNAATGVVPVTVSDCTCAATTVTTTTATTTTTTLLDTGLSSDWVAGSCTRGTWQDPVAAMYGHASGITDDCTEEGAVAVATEAECERACYQLGATTSKKYRRGSWGNSPGCFLMTTAYVGNCHWNTNPDATRTNTHSRSVCKTRAGKGGSRQHPDADLPAPACQAWCADGAANPGARGCEFIYDGPASPNNGCFAVYDPKLSAGGGRVGNVQGGSTNNRFCWVFNQGDTTTAATAAPRTTTPAKASTATTTTAVVATSGRCSKSCPAAQRGTRRLTGGTTAPAAAAATVTITTAPVYYRATGGTSCPPADRITTMAGCKAAAASVPSPFSATTATNRPPGCFWDKNGGVYLNTDLNGPHTLGWGGVGGLCKQA